MKITVIGVGYVGLVSAVGFAEMGNDVVCLDRKPERIRKLKRGIPTIYEPGLADLLKRNLSEGRIQFTLDPKLAIQSADVIFIAVGTPEDEDGRADLSAVWACGEQIANYLKRPTVIVVKSTVPVGTVYQLRDRIRKYMGKKKIGFDVASNPEFLREGAAVKDFLNPDRVVVGVDNNRVKKMLQQLYQTTTRSDRPLYITDIRSAELIKYASNCFLATKISFINEIANFCEKVGANVQEVAKGMGLDPRIGARFLYAGVGYGGSCFPKDVSALIRAGQDASEPFHILESVKAVNETQRKVLIQKIHNAIPSILRTTIAIWGLSFKPRTGDMRDAPSLSIIDHLVHEGANVRLFDPIAMPESRKIFKPSKKIQYAKTPYDALRGASALVVLTEWDEFRLPDYKRMKSLLRKPVIIDGRNIYNPQDMRQFGFRYTSIGRP